MQKGLNPHGAGVYLKTDNSIQELDRKYMDGFDALLLYRLPALFSPQKQNILHFAYEALPDYGEGGYSFPPRPCSKQAALYHCTMEKRQPSNPFYVMIHILTTAGC
jgi:hypothetical protein